MKMFIDTVSSRLRPVYGLYVLIVLCTQCAFATSSFAEDEHTHTEQQAVKDVFAAVNSLRKRGDCYKYFMKTDTGAKIGEISKQVTDVNAGESTLNSEVYLYATSSTSEIKQSTTHTEPNLDDFFTPGSSVHCTVEDLTLQGIVFHGCTHVTVAKTVDTDAGPQTAVASYWISPEYACGIVLIEQAENGALQFTCSIILNTAGCSANEKKYLDLWAQANATRKSGVEYEYTVEASTGDYIDSETLYSRIEHAEITAAENGDIVLTSQPWSAAENKPSGEAKEWRQPEPLKIPADATYEFTTTEYTTGDGTTYKNCNQVKIYWRLGNPETLVKSNKYRCLTVILSAENGAGLLSASAEDGQVDTDYNTVDTRLVRILKQN